MTNNEIQMTKEILNLKKKNSFDISLTFGF